MRVALFLLLTVSFISCKKNKDSSQEPIPNNKALAWMKTYGGSSYDFGNAMVQLSTGEYVMAGSSRSSDGDIGGSRFGFDVWMVKMDNNGNKLWSKTFGDNTDEYTQAIASTNDGGFVVVGYSGFLLGYNGFIIDSFPNYAWAIKVDASGNKVWQKTLSVDSKALAVTTGNDGGIVVAGYSNTSTGGHDGWLMKLDNSGNQVWSKTFGGPNEEQLASIASTSDGGYIAAGFSGSPSLIQNRGDYDGWVIKVDASGNQSWMKAYGGSARDILKSIIVSTDGGYVAAGHSNSNDGDITVRRGGFDEWMIKLDGSGNKVWSKSFGGRNDEIVTTVVNTPDGGYLSAGYTTSTDFDVTRTNGDWGAWLIKTDRNGNKTASSTYGDQFDNVTDKMITTKDGGYIFAGHTDVRTSAGINYDGWIVKIDSL